MIPSFFWAVAPTRRSWTDRGRTLVIAEPLHVCTVLSLVITGSWTLLGPTPELNDQTDLPGGGP